MTNQSTNTNNQTDYKSLLIRSLTSATAGIILSFIILCILAAVLYFNPVNENILMTIAMCSKYVCVIVVAFISCINKRHSGYLRGAMSSAFFIILGAILYYSFYIESFCFTNLLYDILIASIIGLISGAAAVNINTKSK